MYTEKQLERMLGKLKRLEKMLEPKLFYTVGTVPMKAFLTDGSHHDVPEESCFSPCDDGTVFEGQGIYCWFRGSYTVPEELEGRTLFVYPKIRGYEGMLWVNGKPYGNFASKIIEHSHGNHYCDMLCKEARGGETIEMAFEYYANHYIKGTQPFLVEAQKYYRIVYHPVDICLKDEEIADFYFDLKAANGMVKALDKKSFRRAAFVRALLEIHRFISYDFENEEPEIFRMQLRRADAILKKVLQEKNAASAPYAGLIGHSHMDTAWLWHRGETEKKCARTYANQMNLMDQYPDYTFVQSSAYHGDIIKRMYPALFEDIKKRVAEGRYEPNGGVWIECDCNIPSGEYMIRQFVWGQKFTRENFDYTSDAFWLPDTFGYSASLPQIMQGCRIKYFLTTKMAWNDTNVFPYDTFYWKGIDGSQVLVHFNRTHIWPDPEMLTENLLSDGDNTIKERAVSNMRLISYGFGDGGGGPEFGMIEMAERMKDVEGMPRTSHTTVSRFMQELEESLVEPSTYNGELYLELHRGTLTNQHAIKRNNRKAEFALRDLEYLTVRDALRRGKDASSVQIDPLMSEMLVNQFHDILPGTCIPRAHDEAIEAVSHIIEESHRLGGEILEAWAEEAAGSRQAEASQMSREDNTEERNQAQTDKADGAAASGRETGKKITLVNTLSFARDDVVYLPFEGYYVDRVDGEAGQYRQQVVEDMDGNRKLAVMGIKIPAFGSVVLTMEEGAQQSGSVFTLSGVKEEILETPMVKVTFNEKGYMESFVDKRNGRQLKGEGYALNTLLMGEEVSLSWDNWDVDADYECKLQDSAQLLERRVVSDGMVEFRIRSRYRLSAKSTLEQDMIFHADSPEVIFETRMDWQDDHRFLKTAFDTTIHTDYASQEIQFGYIRRVTNRNTEIEKSKFEVSNHKYTDLSETRYGAAVLNDCKYGISVKDSQMRLSLHKGGCMPDERGDKGIHECTYVFLPHMGSLSAGNVIRPAYMLNEKPLAVEGSAPMESLISLDCDHVIVETVKPMEKNGKGFIVRLYEAEGATERVTLTFGFPVKGLVLTNMLEEAQTEYVPAQQLELEFGAFEIKTLMICY